MMFESYHKTIASFGTLVPTGNAARGRLPMVI